MKVTRRKKMCIRCGTTFHDLQDLHQLEVGEDPSGWIKVDLSQVAADTTNQYFGRRRTGTSRKYPIRTHFSSSRSS